MSNSGKSRSRYIVWRICCASALVLTLITFSPVVLDRGSERILWLPASLMVGLFIALGFLLLTVAASRSYPEDKHSGER